MRRLLAVALFALGLIAPAHSQDFVAAGASYQQQAPNVTGWALYAKPITDSGLYSFSEYDVLPKTIKPFVLDSNVRTGFAQRVFAWQPGAIYLCVDAGASISGSTAGGSFGACGLGLVHLGKTKWSLVVGVSGVKSSLSDPTVVYKFGIGRGR